MEYELAAALGFGALCLIWKKNDIKNLILKVALFGLSAWGFLEVLR